ncbi:hypothetical protein KAW50_03610 [candidate division WOR-3 bacterium]|nr:hypothetical protein [candidate division WOR-3 bacterium]
MKWIIVINQYVFRQIAPGCDIKDAAILSSIGSFCRSGSKKMIRMSLPEKSDGKNYDFTWINLNQLIRELPILEIKNKAAISRRIKKLETAGFIQSYQEPKEKGSRLFVRILEKFDQLVDSVDTKQRGYGSRTTGVLTQNNIQPYTNKPNTNNLLSVDKSPDVPENTKSSGVKELIDFFYTACNEIKGFKPEISGAIEGALLKKKLTRYSIEELKQELSWFLGSKHSQELGCTIKVALCTYVFNKWLAGRMY